jgi:serine/threonine protein kinase
MSQSGSSKARSPSGATPPAGNGSSIARGKTGPKDSSDDKTIIRDRPANSSPAGRTLQPQPQELAKLLAGDQLGQFELLEFVGGGGMGAVFRARDTMLDREVALKVLSRSQGADDETRRRFQVEAQSAARLDHQNIARVYYVGEDQGLNFIAFEFIHGSNVRDLTDREGPLPLADAISYTLQIAEALAHASQRNVVHRDIKPSNIIVTEEGRAKLVDMGLARVHVKSAEEDLTASGVTLGTFDYISPEQARDPRTADVRSDMYSLGCTLYYMLTGQPPFPHGTVLQKLLQHQGDDAPDPRQYNADLPPEVVTLMSRLMAKDPKRRFQQPSELIGELLILAERLDLRPVSSSQFWLARRGEDGAWWERHIPWAAPVAALLLIAVGLAWFDAAGRQPSEAVALAPGKTPTRTVTEPAPPTKRADDGATAKKSKSSGDKANGVKKVERPATDVEPNSKANPTPAIPATEANPNTTTPDNGPSKTAQSNTGAGGANAKAEPNSPESSAARPVSSGGSFTDLPLGVANIPGGGRVNLPGGSGKLSEPDTSASISAAPEQSAELSTATVPIAAANATGPNPTVNNGRSIDGTANGPTANGSEAERPGAAGGVSIVGAAGSDRRQFASLKAACASAKNNDVIELQYTGKRDEEPIELTNLRLTIRAAGGHRPVVRFRPTRIGVAGIASGMIAISGGRLNLVNFGLELDIPRDSPADGWSLVEMRRAEEVRLEKCTLTVRNATDTGRDYYANVAIFQLKAAPGAESMRMTEPAAIHPVDLELIDCVARGEAAFVRTADTQPLALQWKNGFLATTGPLLHAAGAASAVTAGQRNQISLSHVTAIVRGGLLRLTATNDAPYQLTTEVKCDNSVLVTREAPLIEQVGPQRLGVLESQFTWSGDRNFCQGFSTFWKLVDLSNPTVPRALAAGPWQSRWGKGDTLLDSADTLWQQQPPADRATSAIRPENFTLAGTDREGVNRFESTDGRNAGMELLDLPATPE